MTVLDQLFSLRGRVALVAGASRGIGAAIAGGLAGAGAVVVGVGRSPAPAEAMAGPVAYRQCDVRDAAAFRAVCDGIGAAHSRLDIYVHAAGITLHRDERGDALTDFRATIESNLTAAYACAHTAAGYISRGGGGSVILITSIGSILGFPDNPAYAASKGGLRMLVKALARDLAVRNIRVNAIAPGYIRTAMTEASYQDPVAYRERLNRMMIPRWGSPYDLVGAAIFLASEASAYITGQDIVVDGGWTAKGL